MFTEHRHVLQCLHPSNAAYPNIFLAHEASHTFPMATDFHFTLRITVHSTDTLSVAGPTSTHGSLSLKSYIIVLYFKNAS